MSGSEDPPQAAFRDPRRALARAMLLGAGVTVMAGMASKLTGALAVQITDDLHFGVAELGMAIAVIHAAGVVSSVPLGRLADRLGAARSIRTSAGVVAVAFIGIALTARNWLGLVAWLAVGSIAARLAQPAANRLLVSRVNPARLGLAFGVKQSAGPASGVIAGVSVPLVGLTLGWRWAFALIAVFGAAVALSSRRSVPAGQRSPQRTAPAQTRLANRRTLVVLAVAHGLQSTTTELIVVFFVSSAAAAGITPTVAGFVLAASSIGAILVRVGAGAICDRMRSGHLRLAAALLLIGTVGIGMLATGNASTMVLGLALALPTAWGQPGVFWFSLVRAYPATPGRVTGVISPAASLGGVFGPLIFGAVAEAAGYRQAWVFVGALAMLASGAMLLGNHRLNAMERPTAQPR